MSSRQTTDTLLLVRPKHFGFNEEAAQSNTFQQQDATISPKQIKKKAVAEFNALVEELESLQVNLEIVDDVDDPCLPDAVFPNNWFSSHPDGKIVIYPMATTARRAEKREEVIQQLQSKYGFSSILDFSDLEGKEQYLEGTGSIVFDHSQKLAFAALSVRTSQEALEVLCEGIGYNPVPFTAYGPKGEPIYHTNVMMCIGESFATVGADVIAAEDKKRILSLLGDGGRDLVKLTNHQVYGAFAGNMLQIRNRKNERILLMSAKALDSLTFSQLNKFEDYNDHIVAARLEVIEKFGGGSIRCMSAEIFPPAPNK